MTYLPVISLKKGWSVQVSSKNWFICQSIFALALQKFVNSSSYENEEIDHEKCKNKDRRHITDISWKHAVQVESQKIK